MTTDSCPARSTSTPPAKRSGDEDEAVLDEGSE
jgi:hypothetical protein